MHFHNTISFVLNEFVSLFEAKEQFAQSQIQKTYSLELYLYFYQVHFCYNSLYRNHILLFLRIQRSDFVKILFFIVYIVICIR